MFEVVEKESFLNEQLVYGLIRSRVKLDNEDMYTYGISVSSRLLSSEDTVELADISTDYGFVKSLYDDFIINTVTPVSAPYIVEEYVTRIRA